MAKYVAAIDQGTTSTRCMIFDHSGSIICFDQREHEQIYPKPGWVEHNPDEIWERTQGVVRGALTKGGIDVADIAAVGITNQRETAVVWNRKTGRGRKKGRSDEDLSRDLADETADLLGHVLLFAHNNRIDLASAIERKWLFRPDEG